MLGFDVSERTASRFLPRRPADPEAQQRWRNLLRIYREFLAAMEFFTVLQLHVTEHPTGTWNIQQLREAFPYHAERNHQGVARQNRIRLSVGARNLREYLSWWRRRESNSRPKRFVRELLHAQRARFFISQTPRCAANGEATSPCISPSGYRRRLGRAT